MAARECDGNCRCKQVGRFRLQNEITKLEYPKWRRDTKNKTDEDFQYKLVLRQLKVFKISESYIGREAANDNDKKKWSCLAPDCCNKKFFSPIQLRNHLFQKYNIFRSQVQADPVIYNMGCGLTAHTPEEAMEKFFQREFQDIHNCEKIAHAFKCIPDSFVFGPVATKVGLEGEHIDSGDMANVKGKKAEKNIFNKLRYSFETLDIKNSVMISGFQVKSQGKNDPQLEIDILIICKDSKTIIQIESKKTLDEKAFEQLDVGYNYINSKIPFLTEHKWKYVKVAYFEQGWEPETNCPKCCPYVLTESSDIDEWLKMINADVALENATSAVGSNDHTYLFVLKFLFYQMYQHEDCITQDDLLKLTDKNIEIISKPQKVLFLNKVQHDLLNAEDCKRVAFLSQFGTGKTTLLKEKARRLLTNGKKVVFVVFKDTLIRGDSLLFQSYKEEFKEFKDLAKFIQIPCAGTTVSEDLKEKIKDNPDFHLMMDEVPICHDALEAKTLNEISQHPSLKDVFIWFACQSEHAPDQILLKDYFSCPDMPHPLRYAASLLKITKLIKDIKGDTNFPSDETNPDVYFNQGPRAYFLTLKRGTNLSCAVEQIVHILEHEKARTLIKIDFHQQRILQELKKSQASKQLIVLEDVNVATEDILANLTDEKILVVSSKDNGFIRGCEFSIVVHFTQDIGGDQVEMIYSRCKSKLIIVCNEDLPKELVSNNFSCDFAKLIPVNDELMPETFEKAITKNQLEHVLREIGDKNRPLPVDATNKASQTGLMVACIFGALNVVEVFLNKGSKLDAVDFQGWAPIHHAAKKGCLEVVKKVTAETMKKFGSEDYKLCLTMKTNEGETALHIASQSGHLTVVQHLVATKVFNVDEKALLGWTPLHLASQFVHFDVVKYLVEECQADVNVKKNDGETPLHRASLNGHLDVVKYLVEECQADVNVKNNDGLTPLHLASRHGHLDVVKYLVEECRADVNVKDNYGETPLHLASSNEHLDVVKYLVEECQADVNVKDNYGETPLYHASQFGRLDVVKFLVKECQADVNVKKNDGETPLHCATVIGHLYVVKYLVEECQADVNVKDNDGWTPLHHASSRGLGHFEVVKYLVEECQADVNVKDDNGRTPIHLASRFGQLDVVKYLVEECQADVNVKNNDGDTPFHFADEPEIVSFLKSLSKIK